MNLDELRYKVYELALKLNHNVVMIDVFCLLVVLLLALHSQSLRLR